MKHLLIICSLFAIGLTAPAFAQEDTASQESALEVAQDLEQALEVDEGRLKLNVNFEDDTSNDEKIKKVTDLVGKFDSELGQEIESELISLSDEDKAEMVESFSQGISFNSGGEDMPIGVVLIAVPAVILIFGMPLFLLIALLSAGHRKRKQKMELVDLYIKNDRDIPEHVMTGLDNGGSASSLKSGLTLTAVGLGLVAAFGANGSGELVGFGLIPMFLGIARLIFWYLVERKNEPQTKENS